MDHAVACALNTGDHEERVRQLGALTANAVGALVMVLCAVLEGVVALVLSRRRPGEGC
jgi:hypothetical protein